MDIEKGVLAVDIETASETDLKKVGAWSYSQDPTTIVYCVVFGYSESAEDAPTFTEWEPERGHELAEGLAEFIAAGGRVVAHNANFERSIWSNVLLPDFDFPVIDLDQWVDTQTLGHAVNLPSTLDGLAKYLGCKVKKDTEGAKLMRKMAKLPNDLDTRENRRRLRSYCRDDVGATLDAYYRLQPLSVTEGLVERADRKINARGMFLDVDFAKACIDLVNVRKRELDDEIVELTSFELADARNPTALKTYLRKRGVDIPKARTKTKAGYRMSETTNKVAVATMLEDPDLDPEARAVLENRAESTKATSLAKLGRVESMIGRDGRLRHALHYCSAHTGRWASSGLQVHNLPKNQLGYLADPIYDAILDRDLDAIKFLSDRPLEAISQSLRSSIAAPPGRELIAADYSAIEARVIAWLANQGDILVKFHRNEDVYTYAARRVGSRDRQLGKVCTLGLGYGMGAVTFATTATSWGVPLTLKQARRIQLAWRRANDAIVAFWHQLEAAAKNAIREPRVRFDVGRIRMVASKVCLFVILPSNRVIRYWRPAVVPTVKKVKLVDEDGVIFEKEIAGEEIRFFSVDQSKGRMVRESTYGGKLAENVTQGIARDVLGEASYRIERVEPYDVVIHVHDSLGAEVPEGQGDVEEFCRILTELPAWANGLPLHAEGYRARRFRG